MAGCARPGVRDRTSRLLLLTAVQVVAAAVLGLLTARLVLVGSGVALVPWAIAAAAVGWFSSSTAIAAGGGAAFGFVLGVSFMVFGYAGAEPMPTRFPAFAVLGLVAAAGAGVVAVLGHRARSIGGRRSKRVSQRRTGTR